MTDLDMTAGKACGVQTSEKNVSPKENRKQLTQTVCLEVEGLDLNDNVVSEKEEYISNDDSSPGEGMHISTSVSAVDAVCKLKPHVDEIKPRVVINDDEDTTVDQTESDNKVSNSSSQLAVIKVEECSLSDMNENQSAHTPEQFDSQQKFNRPISTSRPSPDEPVIIDLDDYSRNNIKCLRAENNEDPRIPDKCLHKSVNEPFPSDPRRMTDSPKLDFLSDKTAFFMIEQDESSHSDINHYLQVQPSIFYDSDNEKFDGLSEQRGFHSPNSQAMLKELNSTDVIEPCNNWEISSIFSNLKEYQYPFLDDGNILQVAQNISPTVKLNLKHDEPEGSGVDSGVFGMSICETSCGFPVENINIPVENNADTSYFLDEKELKLSCIDSAIGSESCTDSALMNETEGDKIDSHSVFQLASNFEYGMGNLTHSTISSQGIHHQAVDPEEQSPNLAFFPCKTVATPDDVALFDPNNKSGYYYSQYPNYDSYYHQNTSNCPAHTSGTQWGAAELANDSLLPVSSKVNSWFAPPSGNLTNDSVMPELVQYLPANAQDDEETDDADEFDNIPVTFPKTFEEDVPQYFASPGSVASTSCFSTDSSLLQEYSPSSVSQPPSASSTPGVTETKSDPNTDFFGSWHVPQTVLPHLDISKTLCPPMAVPNCSLSREQIDPSLLHFGLNQNTKRPFPSMADAMRSARSSRSGTKKGVDSDKPYARSNGRQRKNQIQSAKISTSTPKSKGKKKASAKTKSDSLEQATNDEEDRLEGDELVANRARHNEPLRQHAVCIMLQWFYRNVDNPYPSKADKEAMAREGGITENQVKSWFANKRNRTNNTKPKVQKRAMEEKLMEVCKDLKRNHHNPMADNTHIIQQLSGIIQHYQTAKQE
ncbi:uncharacterized protein LOC101854734 [Aplysia californica]|uniref:Uncharacterized protein LOC101854734 n=1 Tax=Aplysia californica TaxID=6500 RepID=A0ABM0JXD4_APLCA|nr:uncharacterized protein LOC101854734 [Aplysia californica]